VSDASIATIKINEPNLRRAFEFASERGLWTAAVTILLGWRVLMVESGRWSEFSRLLNALPDDVVRVSHEQSEEVDALANAIDNMRVQVLTSEHRLAEAEWLQRDIVTRRRGALRKHGAAEEEALALAASLQHLGTLLKNRGARADCLEAYREALEIAQRSGDVQAERALAYQLASAYLQLAPADLDAAEYWLTYTGDITPTVDRFGRGMLRSAQGNHALIRWNASPGDEGLHWLHAAIKHFEEALTILPHSHGAARAACHVNLGLAYFSRGSDLTRSMQSFEQALSYYEAVGAEDQAGTARLNLARVFEAASDGEKARLYAEAALLTFASLAPDAEGEVLEAQDFLEGLGAVV
jgi:tetratricopeptide (TPR) repeat protein